jgi:hypothetical protein
MSVPEESRRLEQVKDAFLNVVIPAEAGIHLFQLTTER